MKLIKMNKTACLVRRQAGIWGETGRGRAPNKARKSNDRVILYEFLGRFVCWKELPSLWVSFSFPHHANADETISGAGISGNV